MKLFLKKNIIIHDPLRTPTVFSLDSIWQDGAYEINIRHESVGSGPYLAVNFLGP